MITFLLNNLNEQFLIESIFFTCMNSFFNPLYYFYPQIQVISNSELNDKIPILQGFKPINYKVNERK